MLVAITCPQCRHRSYIAKAELPRILTCSGCGRVARSERGSTAELIGHRKVPIWMSGEHCQAAGRRNPGPWLALPKPAEYAFCA